MAKLNIKKFKTDNDTGFASQPNSQGDRLFNRDGSINVKRKGLPYLDRFNIFYELISMRWSNFIAIVILFYILMNVFFGSLYYFIGVEHLNGTISNSEIDKWLESFFFSTQTYATVGYGRINPTGILTNVIASLEALLGVLSLALVTSLLYSRFARPRIKLIYSKNIIIAPYSNKTAVMFRFANTNNELLIECEVQVVLSMKILENEKQVQKFFTLALERSKVASLAANWTIVHELNEDSPLFGYTATEISETEAEFMVIIKAFDDTYSQTVHTRTSYKFDEMIWGAKFLPMFYRSQDGTTTILELDKISDYDLVNIGKLEKENQ